MSSEFQAGGSLAILRSCQRIFDEATLIVYGKPTFVFTFTGKYSVDAPVDAPDSLSFVRGHEYTMAPLWKWLRTIGEGNRLKIRRIKINVEPLSLTGYEDLWENGGLCCMLGIVESRINIALHMLSNNHNFRSLTLVLILCSSIS